MGTDINITLPIYNEDGTPFHDLVVKKFAYESVVMSLGDKITGDVYYKDNTLAVSMREYVEFKINPYDENEDPVKFVLVNPPTIVREGIVEGSGGDGGATKYSFTFVHPMYMLGNFPFSDIAVNSGEEKYLSQNKTFAWIGTGYEFLDKLNKNLEGTQFVALTSSDQESLEKLNKMSEVLSFDNSFIGDALKTCYEQWKVPFVIDSIKEGEYYDEGGNDYYTLGKRFVISFGLPSNEILVDGQPFVFHFGQGVGLKNNSRTPKNNKIVTRISGYGSEGNIPYGYPQIPWYGDQHWDYTINNDSSEPNSYPICDGIVGGRVVRLIKHPFTRKTLMPSVFGETIFNKISPYSERTIDPYESVLQSSEALIKDIESNIEHAESTLESNAFTALLNAVNTVIESQYDTTLNFNGTGYDGSVRKYEGRLFGFLAYGRDYDFEDVLIVNFIDNENYDPNTEIKDYYDADNDYPNPIALDSPSLEIHQFEDIKPELGEAHIISANPYDVEGESYYTYEQWYRFINDYVSTIQERGKYGYELDLIVTLRDVTCLYNPTTVGTIPSAKIEPYSNSWETEKGEAKIDISVTGNFVHAKIESPWYNTTYRILQINQTVDTQWDDTMDDDGNYLQSYFQIKLPILSFDLYACASITEEMKINMRSGSCKGCTFPVQVDWEDYKKHFFDENGTFDPYGERRDYTKYPNSTQEQITILVQKEYETFGTLMPNVYQQPHGETSVGANDGDSFVILGISLPLSYIQEAEGRLDDAMKEYMLENNIYYYEYPLKFDEFFLATHQNILAQIRNNTIVRFVFGNEVTQNLYVKQISVKYGEKPLPQYDITLTDDVEVVLNKIGQVTDEVSKMRVQISELQKYYSQDLLTLIGEKLSRVDDDAAQGIIDFVKSLKIKGIPIEDWFLNKRGEDSTNYLLSLLGGAVLKHGIQSDVFKEGLQDGYGFALVDRDGKWTLEVDNINVRGKMYINELELKKKTYTAGNLSIGNAGNTLYRVTPITLDGKLNNTTVIAVPRYDSNNNMIGYSVIAAVKGVDQEGNITYNVVADSRGEVNRQLSSSDVIGYKCYFVIDDKKMRVTNDWRVGDMARCRTFNIQSGVYDDVSNRDYWRVVVDAGTEVLDDGNTYAYVVLSNVIQLCYYKDEESRECVGRYMGEEDDDSFYIKGDVVDSYGELFYAKENGYDHEIDWGELRNSDVLKMFYGYADGSDVPSSGDDIVQEGNPIDGSRRGLIALDVAEWNARTPKACKFDMYENVGADTSTRAKQFTLVDANNVDFTNPIHIAPNETRISVDTLKIRTGATNSTPLNPWRGAWQTGSRAYQNEIWSYNGSTWVCLVTTTTNAPSTTNSEWGLYVAKGEDGADGKTFDVKGIVVNFCNDWEEFAEHCHSLSLPVATGDKLIVDESDVEQGERGSLLFEYDSAHASDTEGTYYYGWKKSGVVAIGEAYVVRCLTGETWTDYDSHMFLAEEEDDNWGDNGRFRWWQDLGALSGTDGYSINTDPSAIIINETRNANDAISYDVSELSPKIVTFIANVGSDDRPVTISNISSTCVVASVVSGHPNQLQITAVASAYQRGQAYGSATEGTLTVTMSIDGKTFTRTLTVNFNRIGQYLVELKDDTKKELATKTYTYVDGQGNSHTVTAMAGEQIDANQIELFVVNKLNGSDVLKKTSIILTADGKIDLNASEVVVGDGEGAQTIFEQGKIKASLIDAQQIVTNGLAANKVTVKGNIFTPYFRINQSNYNTYVDTDGAIKVADVGANIQVEFQPAHTPLFHPNITLPSVIREPSNSNWLGCELNILNLAKDANGNRVSLDLQEAGINGGIYRYNNGEELENGNVLIRYGEEFQFKVIYLSNPGKCCWFLTRKNHF